jgi:TolB protein
MSSEDELVKWARKLQPQQVAELYRIDVRSATKALVARSSDVLIEAPNWDPEGRWIAVNGDGVMFRIDAAGGSELEKVECDSLPELNNDHLISPDATSFFVSANDGHIYKLPVEGGQAERVTSEKASERRFRHFLHGVSPDGRMLVYVGTEDLDGDEWGTRRIWLLDLESGTEQLLGDGFSPADGPEFSADGRSVLFNSEFESTVEGHAQLFRYDLGSNSVEQLTSDKRVNWFPHESPDGATIVYLSYPAGTIGHPADLEVELRLLDVTSGQISTLIEVFGGQGTINVPSWSPDSAEVAFIAYPLNSDAS